MWRGGWHSHKEGYYSLYVGTLGQWCVIHNGTFLVGSGWAASGDEAKGVAERVWRGHRATGRRGPMPSDTAEPYRPAVPGLDELRAATNKAAAEQEVYDRRADRGWIRGEDTVPAMPVRAWDEVARVRQEYPTAAVWLGYDGDGGANRSARRALGEGGTPEDARSAWEFAEFTGFRF